MFASVVVRNFGTRAPLRLPHMGHATASSVRTTTTQAAPAPASSAQQSAAAATTAAAAAAPAQRPGRRLSGRSPLRTPLTLGW